MATKAFDRHLARLRRQLTQQHQQAADAIACESPASTRLSLPPGDMLLWMELPGGVFGMAVFEAALAAAGIRLAPRTMFSNSDHFDHYLHLSCVGPDRARAEQAIRTLGAIVTSHPK